MPKPKLLPETEGSVYQAWQPHLGRYDIRWASELPPFGRTVTQKNFDMDIDVYRQLDLDNRIGV